MFYLYKLGAIQTISQLEILRPDYQSHLEKVGAGIAACINRSGGFVISMMTRFGDAEIFSRSVFVRLKWGALVSGRHSVLAGRFGRKGLSTIWRLSISIPEKVLAACCANRLIR